MVPKLTIQLTLRSFGKDHVTCSKLIAYVDSRYRKKDILYRLEQGTKMVAYMKENAFI